MTENVESRIKAAIGKFSQVHREFSSNTYSVRTNLNLLIFFVIVRFGSTQTSYEGSVCDPMYQEISASIIVTRDQQQKTVDHSRNE